CLVQLSAAVAHGFPAPSEPGPPALAQRRLQAYRQPAGTGLARHGDAVGDDDQAAHEKSCQGRDSRIAAITSPTCEYVCGKLPHSSPLSKAMSSDSRPRWLRRSSMRSNSARASSMRPIAASASMYQNVQMVKLVSGTPKSSGAR